MSETAGAKVLSTVGKETYRRCQEQLEAAGGVVELAWYEKINIKQGSVIFYLNPVSFKKSTN